MNLTETRIFHFREVGAPKAYIKYYKCKFQLKRSLLNLTETRIFRCGAVLVTKTYILYFEVTKEQATAKKTVSVPALFADRDLYNPTLLFLGLSLVRWACRPPAAVPSSEEGSAKSHGVHPPAVLQVIIKRLTATRDSLLLFQGKRVMIA